MKTKLRQVEDCLLFIDEEAEIEEWDFYYDTESKLIPIKQSIENSHSDFNGFKILAYYPLTKEAKKLDLPLLPPFEENIDCWLFSAFENEFKYENNEPFYSKVFFNHTEMKIFSAKHSIENKSKFPNYVSNYWKHIAQSKQFSLEDMKKAFEYYAFTSVSNQPYNDSELEEQFEEFIQSLSTQQFPKEFIPEYDSIPNFIRSADNIQEDYRRILKIIINSEGKQELVGTYIN